MTHTGYRGCGRRLTRKIKLEEEKTQPTKSKKAGTHSIREQLNNPSDLIDTSYWQKTNHDKMRCHLEMVNQGVTKDILPALRANYLQEVYCLLISRLLVHRVIDNFQKIGLTDPLVELQIIIGPILHFLKNKSYFTERQTAVV